MTPAETIAILRRFSEWRLTEDEALIFEIGEAIDVAVEMIERMEKIEVALEAILNSGLLSGQYTIHDKMTELARAALEESK